MNRIEDDQLQKTVPKTRKAISVFLVDDNETYLATLSNYLHKQFGSKIKIEAFTTGEDCLKEIEKNPTIEVVILDYYLTESPNVMNGPEVLKKIKEINSDILVVMLSAEDTLEIATDCITSGAYEYVVKSASAFIRTENILKNLIHEVRLQAYYPSDIGGEA